MRFEDFARSHGVLIKELEASDRVRRCPTVEHPRSTNGAYHWDGQRGWVMAWDGEGKAHWFDDPSSAPWTDGEKRTWAARRQSLAADQERKYENAALRASVMLRSARPGTHGYLMRKGFPEERGLCMPDGELFIPMRHLVTNDLQGGQIVRWLPDETKWEKKMVPGMRAKGAVYRIGSRSADETILCEGYATGLSIQAAARELHLTMSVLVCFSDSNMVHVAPMVKGRVFVFADHDKSGAGQRAAVAIGKPYCMSGVEGEDANDMHMRAGTLAVASKLLDVRVAEAPVPS